MPDYPEFIRLMPKDIELIRSALHYYHTGSPYPGERGDQRQRTRARRAGNLAAILDRDFPSTIDETGDGSTVELTDG